MASWKMPRMMRIVAILIPLFEILAMAYASVVFTYDVAWVYLLGSGRSAAAIVVLTLFWLLFVFMICPLLRNFWCLYTNPPYVTRDVPNESELEKAEQQQRQSQWSPRDDLSVYTCEGDGLPRRCAACNVWKPDRAHHSSDLGRCVTRMDHFCPWFGGIVGHTNHKFFLQFIFFTALWCIFGVITLAIFINEQRVAGQVHGGGFVRMCVCIALQALFGNFTAAMTVATTQNVLKNKTDIELLQSGPQYLAIRVDSSARRIQAHENTTPKYAMRYFWPNSSVFVPPNSPNWNTVAFGTAYAQAYAIVPTQAGEHPFDLGSPYANFCSLMGSNIFDWILPIHSSPASSFNTFGPLIGTLAARHDIPKGL